MALVPLIRLRVPLWRIKNRINEMKSIVEIKNKQVLPVEVKYKTKIRNSDFNNLFIFCKKFHVPKAVILINTIYLKMQKNKSFPNVKCERQALSAVKSARTPPGISVQRRDRHLRGLGSTSFLAVTWMDDK